MRRKLLMTILILSMISVLIFAVAGCGNLSSKASIASVGGTQSDPISLIDGRYDTFWKGNASGSDPVYVIFNFRKKVLLNTILLDEEGSSVRKFELQVPGKNVEDWQTIYHGTTVPEDGLITFDDVEILQLKFVVMDSKGEFKLREMSMFYEKPETEETTPED